MGKLIKNTLAVSGLTAVSRVFGMLRDVIIAMVFGASGTTDAFFSAFRFPDLLRKLFSEGILSISFIPAFTRVLEREGRSAAASMAVSALLMVSVLVTVISVAGLFSAPLILKAVARAPGESYVLGLTMILFKWMIPYLVLISLLAVCMGVLNTLDNFVVPAAGPLVFNLVVIFFALIVSPLMDTPIVGIAVGVTAGGLVQLACQIPFLRACGMLSFRHVRLLHPDVLNVFKTMIPAMIGGAGYQINVLFGTFLAVFLGKGAVSYLYYADRLVQFAAGILTVSVAMVILPRLSRKAEENRPDELYHEFFKGVRLVSFMTIPAMAGLIALRYQVVELLFGRGAFDIRAVQETAHCLLFLSLGLWAVSANRLMVTLYHSLSDFRRPFYAGMASIFINGIGSILLVRVWGLAGIAAAISGAAVINFIWLAAGIRPSGPGHFSKTGWFIIKTTAIAMVMYLGVTAASILIFFQDYGKLTLLFGVAGCILLGIVIYLGIHMITGGPGTDTARELIKRNK